MTNNLLNKLVSTTALTLILAACGGGGGGISKGAPVDIGGGTNTGNNGGNNNGGNNGGTNTPAPGAGLTQRDASYFLTSEYNKNVSGGTTGLAQVNAAAAYATGASGNGITVGIIDTGFDMDNAEFAGAFSSKSISIITNDQSAMQTLNPHGTWVAGVVGARKNDTYTHGIAFNATMLAIAAATYDSGACSNGCFQSDNIAKSIRYAANNDARVVNMSFGAPGALGVAVTEAAQYAASKNVLMVVAAGNEGLAQVDSPANLGSVNGIVGSLLAVGAVDENNNIASFSNRAGNAKNFYLVAPGERILTTDEDGMALTAGTSFAAPMVAGAAALVMEYAPYLTAKQVAQILLRTATDLGATGVDDVYGYGLLNVGAAVSPVGVTSVPTSSSAQGGGEAVSDTQVALSAAFGNALSSNSLLKRGIMVDEYGRAFGLDMNNRVSHAQYESGMAAFVGATQRRDTVGSSAALGANGFVSASFTSNEVEHGVEDIKDQGKMNGDMRFALSAEARDGMTVTYTHGHNLAQGFGMAEATSRMASDTATANAFDNAFLSLVDGGNAMVTSLRLADGLALNIGGGMEGATSSFTSSADNSGSRQGYAAELAYNKDGLKLGLQAGAVHEEQSALASNSDGALAFGQSSNTTFVAVNATIPLMQGLALAATYQVGFTQITSAADSMISDFRGITSDKFAIALMADDVMKKGDRLTFGVSQPIRVSGGSANLTVPVAVNNNGQVINASQRVNLSPTARQIDVQAGYSFALDDEQTLGISTVGTLNPGHDKNADPALAVGVRYTSKF